MASDIMRMKDIDRSTEFAIVSGSETTRISIADYQKWFESTAPPGEILKFLLICRSAGLNPILNDAYLVKMKDKWSAIISKGGYLKRAGSHKNADGELDFNGFEAGIVVREQATDPKGNPIPGKTKGLPIELEGAICPSGYLLIGGWARVYRKGIDRPFKAAVSLAEYDQGNYIWNKYKCTMIRKVPLVHAIREAFAISDSYDESEFGTIEKVERPGLNGATVTTARVIDGSPGGPLELEAIYADDCDPICPPEQVSAILRLKAEIGMTDADLDGILMRRGYSKLTELSPNDASSLIARMEERASRPGFVRAFPDMAPASKERSAAYTGARSLDAEIVDEGTDTGEGAEERSGAGEMAGVGVDVVAVGSGRPLPPDGEPDVD